MELGKYEVHEDIQNEDKWLKFFTLPQLGAIALAIVAGIGIIVVFSKIGLVAVGIFLCILIVLAVVVCVMIPMPEDRYLFGGGELIGVLAIRLILKKTPLKKKLYISNYKK